jgi:hypothetical protein
MITDYQIPEPVLFNPLKHHLGFIRDFVGTRSETGGYNNDYFLIRDLKHLGTSVMDVYSGSLSINKICEEVLDLLFDKKLTDKISFSAWTGMKMNEFRIIPLSDGSEWTIKYHNNISRFVHIFPARGSRYTFRIKSNTLKSALLYYVKIGKDYITADDLNRVRPLLGLSPVKDLIDSEAIIEMIEIIRN